MNKFRIDHLNGHEIIECDGELALNSQKLTATTNLGVVYYGVVGAEFLGEVDKPGTRYALFVKYVVGGVIKKQGYWQAKKIRKSSIQAYSWYELTPDLELATKRKSANGFTRAKKMVSTDHTIRQDLGRKLYELNDCEVILKVEKIVPPGDNIPAEIGTVITVE